MATVSARSFPSIPHAESSEVVNSMGWTRHRVSNLSMQIIFGTAHLATQPHFSSDAQNMLWKLWKWIHPNTSEDSQSRVRRESEHVRTVSSLAFWFCTVGIRASGSCGDFYWSLRPQRSSCLRWTWCLGPEMGILQVLFEKVNDQCVRKSPIFGFGPF